MKTNLVAIVDDHTLIRSGLVELINTFDEYQVLFDAGGYDELVENIKSDKIPHIVLLDVNMPGKNGYDTSLWLRDNYPDVKICALSMNDSDISIIRMLRTGARGYLPKACATSELKLAMDAIMQKGYHYSEILTGHLLHSIRSNKVESGMGSELSEREITFLKYACTEMSYKQIGKAMFLSSRTIEGYGIRLCEKLNVTSRIGLVLYAIKHNIVTL